MNSEVCCVVVTYNRKKDLLVNIKHLLMQSVGCDILIFNNASTDGTEEYLKENKIFESDNVIYHRSKSNIGGAGGFSEGLKIAYNAGYKYFWLMDDDGHPKDEKTLSNCLSKINSVDSEYAIINSLVICDDNKLSFELCKTKDTSMVIKRSRNNILPDEIRPFNGTLITRSVVAKIGFPKAEFFIKGDEIEYLLRAKKAKVLIATAVDSLYFHPELVDQKIKLLGKSLALSDESYWKEYYKARNYVYINREYLGLKGLIKHILISFIKIIYYKSDKKRKILYTIKGLKDGFTNNFERIKIK